MGFLPKLASILLLLVTFQNGVKGDTPANCTHDDLVGKWKFYLSSGGHSKDIDCSNPGVMSQVISLTLSSYNAVTKDDDGEVGSFNLIYNQGFEVTLGYRKLFAFFKYDQINSTYADYWCNQTMQGWSHDVLGNDWACFKAVKQDASEGYHHEVVKTPFEIGLLQLPYSVPVDFIELINLAQDSWTATVYPEYEKYTYDHILRRSGFLNGPLTRPKKNLATPYSEKSYANLPKSFDWRNVNGVNYLSPIRNQGHCGSCYAFASMGMLEARMRILTNNTQTPVFSPQDVVACSRYSQGCDGGFPYLIAGKYAQDFGVVEEQCYPYLGKNQDKCEPTLPNCQRTHVAKYEYVGGYYGGCSEEKMMQELVNNGPLAVAIEVYPDFQQYKSGIYHHVESIKAHWLKQSSSEGYNPFELTNHAVLAVGYGEEVNKNSDQVEKYWIVKNSWGEQWGEQGFVRIRRGTDEIAIESLAQQSWPIPRL